VVVRGRVVHAQRSLANHESIHEPVAMHKQVALQPVSLQVVGERKARLEKLWVVMQAESQQLSNQGNLLIEGGAAGEYNGLNREFAAHVKKGQERLNVKLKGRELRRA